MMKVKRGLGIFLFILSGINGFSNSTQLSEFVINSVRHNEQLVKNYSVSFSYQFYDSNGKNIIPPKGGNSIISKESFTFVREGTKFYCENKCQMSDGYVYEAKASYNGKRMINHRLDMNGALISSRRDIPTSLTADRFTNLYVNVRDMTMSEFLEASRIKTITPIQENGYQCYLVEVVHCDSTENTPIEQKIYFNASLGFSPIKVETYNLNISKSYPVMVAEAEDYYEVSEGIYFPKKGRIINYLKIPDEEGKLQVDNEIRVDIDEVKVNMELPENYFEYTIPQGVKVYDSVTDITYTVGEFKGSMDEINRMFDGAHKEVSADTRKTVSPAVSGIDVRETVSEDKENSILASSDQTPSKTIILDTSNSGILNRIILFLLITLMVIAICLVARFFIKQRKS